jgi:hypothetical protein
MEGNEGTIRKENTRLGDRSWRKAILQIRLGVGYRIASAGRPTSEYCHSAVVVQFQRAPSARPGSAVNRLVVSVVIIGIDQVF